MSKAGISLTDLMPSGAHGWKAVEADQTYTRDDLFEYIDGGAELYLSYGFTEMLSRRYTRTGQPDIVVDIFDMRTSQNAFGVFSHSRETLDRTFGQGSQYTPGLLLFWKDNFYISILASPETVESKRAVFDLAERIAGSIPGEGPLPDIYALLPSASLIEKSVRYFFHYIWLNSHYFVADKNILNIDETCEAILAKYAGGEGERILLLVRYDNDQKAEKAYDSFVGHYLPELSDTPVVQIEDGTWTGCRRNGNLLIIVFNAPSGETAIDLINAVIKRSTAG